MSSILSFYLDGTIVQAMRADMVNGLTEVQDVRTFPLKDLDSYLSGCREKVCIVCCNPPVFYQDIVHLPPATVKFYDSLVRAEVKKIHPSVVSFTLFYRIIGEATVDGNLLNKITAFSYIDDYLSDFISVFNRHGITISRLYAAPYAIFRLAASACSNDPALARIFIAPVPGEKLILLSENGELGFIRKVPSPEPGLDSADIKSIDMTADYCSQALRVKPAEAVMLRPAELPEAASPAPVIPFRFATPAEISAVPADIVRDYLAPLASMILDSTRPEDCDILPPAYVSFKTNKKILTVAAMVLVVLSLFLSGFIISEYLVVADLGASVKKLRLNLGNPGEELTTYRKLDDEMKSFGHLSALLQRITTLTTDRALASLVLPRTTAYQLKKVSLKKEDGFIHVHLDGAIYAASMKETQGIFENLVDQVRALPGYSLTSSNVDIKQQTFSMEARYSGDGKQGK